MTRPLTRDDPNNVMCACGHPGAWHLTDSRLCVASVGPDAINSGAGAFLSSSGGTQCPCAGFAATGAHWLDSVYGVLKDVPQSDGAPPMTRSDLLSRVAQLVSAYEAANDGAVVGVDVEFPVEPSGWESMQWDGGIMREGPSLSVSLNAIREKDARIATLEAGLRDAIDALADMTGFVEAQFYAEKYGIAETVARLRLLLPPEDSVATVKEPGP